MIYLYDLLILVFIIISIALDAYSDAYQDDYNKRNHYGEALSILSLMTAYSIFVYQISWFNVSMMPEFILVEIGKMLGVYILLRAGIFNIAYNEYRNNSVMYVGETDDVLDKWLNKLPNWSIPIFYISSIFGSLVLTFI